MLGLSWMRWGIIIVGGVLAGLLLAAALPHHAGPMMHSGRVIGPGAGAAPPFVIYLPYVLMLGGLVLGALNRNNAAFLTFAGTAITAGLTLAAK